LAGASAKAPCFTASNCGVAGLTTLDNRLA
jgi:hypothetical protein